MQKSGSRSGNNHPQNRKQNPLAQKDRLKPRISLRKPMEKAGIRLQKKKQNGRKPLLQPRLSWKMSLQPWEWNCSSKSSSVGKTMKSS